MKTRQAIERIFSEIQKRRELLELELNRFRNLNQALNHLQKTMDEEVKASQAVREKYSDEINTKCNKMADLAQQSPRYRDPRFVETSEELHEIFKAHMTIAKPKPSR